MRASMLASMLASMRALMRASARGPAPAPGGLPLATMDAYIVIGNPHTRKSSLVRCLTGCFNRSVRDIQPLGGRSPMRLYARVGALQDTKTSAEDFIAEVARARCSAALFCLAPSAHANHPDTCPDAVAYLDALQAAGWRVRAIAVLGQNAGGVKSASLRQFPLATTAPINVTAHAVRAHFGWE
jgi:hypothetical protein